MHGLIPQLEQLGRQAERRALLRAGSWTLVALLGVGLLLIVADAIVRWYDPGLRWLVSLAWWGSLVALAIGWLWPIWRTKLTAPTVAQLLERYFPSLRDRLTSSVDFLTAGPSAIASGSAALRERVVLETTAEVEGIELQQALDWQPLKQATLALLMLLAMCLGLAIWQPELARIGLSRLLVPWSSAEWPREYVLTVNAPQQRIARGQSWLATVSNRQGQLPSDVVAWFRSRDAAGNWQLEEQPLPWRADQIELRREQVRSSFQYRVTGGDDQGMTWQTVELVEPAELHELTFQLQPPVYTGWPKYSAKLPLHILPGTRISVIGQATRPLQSSRLRTADRNLELTIQSDQKSFALPLTGPAAKSWQPTQDESATLELVNRDGITTVLPEPCQVHLVPDAPPQWNSETIGNELLVTPTAKLPLVGLATDDVGLEQIRCELQPGEVTVQPISQVLWSRSSSVTIDLDSNQLQGIARGRWPLDRQAIQGTLDLGPHRLTPGQKWQLVVIVRDRAGQEVTTAPRALQIVTPSELASRLEQQLNSIINELTNIIRLQQELLNESTAGSQLKPLTVAATRTWLRWPARQRQVAQALTDEQQSTLARLNQLAGELNGNGLDQTGIASQVQQLAQVLRGLRSDELPSIDLVLEKLGQQLSTDTLPLPTELNAEELSVTVQQLVQGQTQVLRILNRLLAQLGQATQLANLDRDLGQLIARQRDLQKASLALLPTTLGRRRDELKLDEQLQLDEQMTEQQSVTAAWEKWKSQLQRAATSQEPTIAAKYKVVQVQLQGAEPSTLMSAAARDLAENRLGQASTTQQTVLDILQRLQPALQAQQSPNSPDNKTASQSPDKKQANEDPEQAAISALLDEVIAAIKAQQELLQATQSWQANHGELVAAAEATAQQEFAELVRQQQTLLAQVQRWETTHAKVLALRHLLRRIEPIMQTAINQMTAGQVTASTTELQTSAVNGLEMLQAALASVPPPEQPMNPMNKPPGDPNAKQQQQTPSLKLTPWQIAELKLLRVMQLELNERTERVRGAFAKVAQPTAAEQRLAQQLAEDQERLRELLLQIVPAEAPAD